MDVFLSSIGQHLTSYFNLSLMKSINTGDRMLDTTLQMLLSTLVGGFITFLITTISKGLWKEYVNQLYAAARLKSYNPLVFNPNIVPEKPINGLSYLYEARIDKNSHFLSWFYTYHMDKKFAQKHSHPLLVVSSDIIKNLLDLQNFKLSHEDICFEQEIPVWRGSDGSYVFVRNSRSSFKLCLYSDSGTAIKECFIHMDEHVQTIKNYEEKTRSEETCQQIWEYSSEILIERGKIEVNRDFNSLFFKGKPEIISVLTNFRDGTLFPKHLPIDNKLGIILHGPPGTGKTGFIAAVANFLKRNILLVNMNRIKTRTELDEVLGYDKKTHIWVFEEFDCAAGVAKRTDSVEKDPNELSAYTMMLLNQKEQSESIMKELRNEKSALNDKLDLQYLLTKLDGLESANDRLIIATTNHPERIDPALLRPGRFGLELELTYCDAKMLKDIIGMIFQTTDVDVSSVKEDIWTPAEILQLGITKGSVEKLLEHLQSSEPGQRT